MAVIDGDILALTLKNNLLPHMEKNGLLADFTLTWFLFLLQKKKKIARSNHFVYSRNQKSIMSRA